MEAELLEGWLRARSIARGLPQPVADHGGLRVDTGLPHERRRYVFAGPAPGISELALKISEPHIYIKMLGPAPQLLAQVNPKWTLQPGGYFMTKEPGRTPVPSLPPGYRLQVITELPLTTARILAEDDTVAASGYAAEYEGVFVFDRIATAPAHQHQGLGAAIMAALGGAQQSQTAQRVLVATEAGRSLYTTIGWRVRSPYSTVAIKPLS
ncbi:N-acetyltransferase [Duganella sp. FT80W]|uniref:N-acetyltransferase n=1 Tax=Duganella guangzhouensis TaxID=2666084 RepID=A0A6I2KSR5_9BURK|nr:GNAT family N-acetyltransferase [Duganella guangzhouensis]MRW88778.1 N-acetyltransferase [Duganella guangzhouensis]